MWKTIIISFILSASAFFAATAGAQQENMNAKILELQEQWKHIMQSEYNPSAIELKAGRRSSLDSTPSLGRQSRKSVHKRTGSYNK
jgi:hypothetical protein